ncbi:hypothetical protein RIF29_08002 [Crotalaria pallida]|uniref:ABC transporter domain-containing protein n=1 Tax=Crotalaria pallida TaxID=3830 RepID=A0AAN9J5W9_CROPI
MTSAGFWTQTDALLRKNLTYQKRNMKANIRLVLFPVVLCVLLALMQRFVDNVLSQQGSKECNIKIQEGEEESALFSPPPGCPVPKPYAWSPLLQLPSPLHRAVQFDIAPFTDLPPKSCMKSFSCPVTMLFTATNFSFAQSVNAKMFPGPFAIDPSVSPFASNVMVSYFFSTSDLSASDVYKLRLFPLVLAITCVQGLRLWRNSSSVINDELYKGYKTGNTQRQTNEYVGAFDLLDSNSNRFNVSIWYNLTDQKVEDGSYKPVRVARFVNLVVLASLVYEKEQKLRIMMKMHGLGDGPYWMISYAYFLTISVVYMLFFVIFGSLLGLKFFTSNDYKIQFVFYFMYVNLQVAVAFLASTMFSNAKTATVTAYILVFGTGLLGGYLFDDFLKNPSFPRVGIMVMELYFGFALYRGLSEFGESAIKGEGMRWADLSDSTNGLKEVLILMFVEWIVVLFVAYYIDHGRGKSAKGDQKKSPSSVNKPTSRKEGYKSLVHLEKPDVMQEREKVEQLVLELANSDGILCDELSKVYPPRDGNPEKVAVRGLSLAVPRGECFGMLGPNGAGKTSFISMMIGLTKPSAGTAYVEGSALTQAVEDSLKSLDIFHGVADKPSGSYSGGMKRRLSVAISLIGDPKVVYMDEPSTGLDPASRNSLWNVVKQAKKDRAILLTTHSMEEAEALCDRLGVFVSGGLRCVGNSNELKSRYGGTYVLAMTTSSDNEKDVENIVLQLSPNANKIYHLSGTQKFELSKEEVRIADVFKAVESAKKQFTVSAWGLADTTLEDVFIKVAREAQESIALS